MMQHSKIFILFCAIAMLCSCSSKVEKGKGEEAAPEAAQTPVTVTSIDNNPLTEYLELNATSAYMQKSYAKANAGGYIKSMNATPGKYVNAGQVLFTLKTKEAESIGNTINKLDPAFKFTGVNNIRAGSNGFITQLNHQVGDYVQDGEQLAVISDENSFAFVLELPYELKKYVPLNKHVEVILPDSTHLDGWVAAAMPTVDPTSQTQSMVIKVPQANHLPENLIAKVRIVKNQTHTASLPKTSILSNDIQSEFWVMKMMDSVTAVKVPVQKGIETKDRVEILSPVFRASDRILTGGNYGLGDTAKVKIVQ
ncbi:MAG: efflux RND transporter periplasmic adaptor subunit [Flavipsychrobacter sp.]|nr:efflux RND transporter periplasmic adaptor subunit [Flavipsychrobacter sp.]